MSSEEIDAQTSATLKAVSMQQAGAPSPQNTDPQLEQLMQSMLIQDTELMRILKGEIHEYLNKLEQMMTWMYQNATPMFEMYKDLTETETNKQLSSLNAQLYEMRKQMELIGTQLKRYRRYVPYLLLFTSTSVLSNITRAEAEAICRKIDIMVMRDRLDCSDDETALEDINFFDSIGIRLKLHILRNVEGFTFKGLIEERRTVHNIFSEPNKQKKGRFGGLL